MKLAELLRVLLPDVDVQPEDLTAARGWYRTSNSLSNDTYRWECFTRLRELPKVLVVFGSFSTMTSCVKYGVSATRERLYIHVESNEPAPKKMSNV